MRSTGVLSLFVLGSLAPAARADDAAALRAGAPVAAAPSRHLIYAELLGKAGAYGIGYEYALGGRVALGVAGSYAPIRDQQLLTLAPYVHATLVRGRRHALFGELGAVVAHSRIPSPVEDWDGMTDSGAGGFASLGWERASRHLVLRAAGAVVVGEGGAAPWLGLAVGVRP